MFIGHFLCANVSFLVSGLQEYVQQSRFFVDWNPDFDRPAVEVCLDSPVFSEKWNTKIVV